MRILLPIDFSEQALAAFELAVQIAEKTKSDLHALHIIEAPGANSFNAMGEVVMDDFYNNAYFVHRIKESEKQLENLRNSLHGRSFNFSSEIQVGNTYHHISREIPKREVDLVVMGTKGISGFAEVMIGSNTEKVIRHSNCPVITVKSKLDLNSIKRVVAASDFEKGADGLVKQLIALGGFYNGHLDLLCINTPNHFSTTWDTMSKMKKVSEQLKGLFSEIKLHVINDYTEEEGISHFMKENEADLLIMGTGGRRGLLHLLTGSIAEDIVNHLPAPVWVFPISKK